MASRAVCIALLLSSLSLAGCGTVANLARQRPGSGGVSPFGGVRHDVSCIEKAASGEADAAKHAKSEESRQRALRLLWTADLPFSFIGDVVTWPYTAAYTFINQPVPVPPPMPVPSAGQPYTYPLATTLPDLLKPPPPPAEPKPEAKPEPKPEPKMRP